MTQPGDLRLAVGMVGGGPGSTIGVARPAGLLLDDRYRLVAGSFAHCYSAYAMVRHAARLVRDRSLGALRYVDVEHASGWASTLLEAGEHTPTGIDGLIGIQFVEAVSASNTANSAWVCPGTRKAGQ
ncbi:MAG TPA: hypothetical protein VGK53_21970 [Propionicimonas sp.]|jgi:hypothetical protein